jgi:hypothetical protein
MVQVAKWPSPVKDKPKKDVYKLSRIWAHWFKLLTNNLHTMLRTSPKKMFIHSDVFFTRAKKEDWGYKRNMEGGKRNFHRLI